MTDMTDMPVFPMIPLTEAMRGDRINIPARELKLDRTDEIVMENKSDVRRLIAKMILVEARIKVLELDGGR